MIVYFMIVDDCINNFINFKNKDFLITHLWNYITIHTDRFDRKMRHKNWIQKLEYFKKIYDITINDHANRF